LLKLQIFPPLDLSDIQVQADLQIARDGYEIAVLLSLHQNDLLSFERNFLQLKPYYYEFSVSLPQSPRRWPILGLHLLFLLAQSRIAEFHTELELLLPIAPENNSFIAYPIALEQELMEGSYRSLWEASNNVPFPDYTFLVRMLTRTSFQIF
jgi:26S proteasome regulatory subunit N12